MLFIRRAVLIFAASFALTCLAAAASPAPVALPAFVDAVTFQYNTEGQNHKVIVTTSPTLVRVDETDDQLSVIYNPQTQYYIGLEKRNDTYWQFSWPQVSSVVQNSKRYESRLQELGNEGLNADMAAPPAGTNPATGTATASSAGTDDSGYVWRPTTDHKRIANLDCIRWIADTVSGQPVEAWCYAGALPNVQAAIARLREINGPMALVPVRTMAPDFVFPVFDALGKGGVTPLLINWGADTEKSRFSFVEARTRESPPDLFAVPKIYVKTTLVTMDGMIDQGK